MDVRILALGVVNRPRTSFTINRNAHTFLYPPGLEPPGMSIGDSLDSRLNVPDSRSQLSGVFVCCRLFEL